ncbi:hypothetical protein HYDPIDRAFT_30481, partial [Hydnomerulius pinastri MD-312]
MKSTSIYESPSADDSRAKTVLPNQRVIITNTKAISVAAGLRRILAGFYASVSIGDDHWRTTNKPECPTTGVTEWNDAIHLPSDLSTEVGIRLYASFELGYTLGQGELLREFSITVGELLERSHSSCPIPFSARDGEVVSSCSALEVTVEVLLPSDDVLCRPAAARVETRPHEELFLAQTTDLGHIHVHDYYKNRQQSRLDEAIREFELVVDRCPSDHPGRSAALSNLAMAKFISCQAREAHLDLDEPISLFQEALDLRPPHDPDHPCTLINLSIALLARFRGRGYVAHSDIDKTEELLRQVLVICPPESHAHKVALDVIAFSGRSREDNMPVPRVSPQASSWNWRLPSSLNELTGLLGECETRDDSQLLDDVIAQHLAAENHFVADGQEWVVLQNNLIVALQMRFERQGRVQDLDESIQRGRAMSLSCPNDSGVLNNLANALRTRFKQRGDGKDLDEAIEHRRVALQLTPAGRPDRADSLDNLASALSTRFSQRGDGKDLDEAIEYHRVALQLRPAGHPRRSSSLISLGNALSTRFSQRGDGKDLDEAI